MRIQRGYVSLVNWTTFPQALAFPASVKPAFSFLHDEVRTSGPPIAGPLKFTQIAEDEVTGLRNRKGTDRIWKCVTPYVPVISAPDLGLSASLKDKTGTIQATFSPKLRVYLHPFGVVFIMENIVDFSAGADGVQFAQVLDALERQKSLAVRCGAFDSAKNIIELFVLLRVHLANVIFSKIEAAGASTSAESSFCVAGFGQGTLPQSYKELLKEKDDQRQLFWILRRKSGNQQPSWPEFNERRFMEAGMEAGSGDESGWRFCTGDGIAAHTTGTDPNRAQRANLCHHRNIAKLIGMYRLYHAFIELLDQQNEIAKLVPPRMLEHAVNGLDRMRIQYSAWWIRWATTRPQFELEKPVVNLVRKFNLDRQFPPHEKAPSMASQTEGTTIVIKGDARIISDNLNMVRPNNPWISGSFYLFLLVVVFAVLLATAKFLSPWWLPVVIVGGLLLVTLVGALQLRNDDRLREENFLKLVQMAFKQIPLLGRLVARGNNSDSTQ